MLLPLTLIHSKMVCQQRRRASLSPSAGGPGSCSILPCQLPTAQPRCITCRADGVGYLLNIPLCVTAKANTMAFLTGFSQSRVYIKFVLIHNQCCPVHSKSSQKFEEITMRKWRVLLWSVTHKARNKYCLLFQIILSTPADDWQGNSMNK